jgi:hypothetical protein
MNIALLFWLYARRAAQALGRSIEQREYSDVESYLSKSQSLADLESRQRDWLQSH